MCKKKYYKLISVVVVIAILFTTVNVSAFAQENKEDGELASYQTFFDDMGFETNMREKATEEAECFDVIVDGTVNTIEKTILENGDVLCLIQEGDLTNEMLITKEGKVYIDGSLISVGETEDELEPLIIDYSIFVPTASVARAQRYEFTTKCPYGNPSDYTNSTTVKKVLSLGEKKFKDVLISTWATIVKAAISLISAPAAVITALGMKVALTYLKSKHPNNKAASIKDVRSVHKTKGFTVSSSMSVAKHSTTYYVNKDYTGIIKDDNGKSTFIGYEVYTY